MTKSTIRKIRKWLLIIAAVYVLIGLVLWFFQDKILFHPEKLPIDHQYNFTLPYREVNLRVTDSKTMAIVQFSVPDSLRKGVVLYFHGNKRNVERYAPFASAFTKNNYEVWMMDYPGYGKSTGELSEQVLYDDALEFYNMARAYVSKDSLIIYGKSMGTGIAAQLASIRECKRVILETPYYDFPSVIKHYMPIYPVSLLLHYKIPTHEFIRKIKAPITIFQGTDDGVITHSNAKKLIPLLRTTDEFITIKNGSHNDLYQFPDCTRKLDSLLSK
jgi:uncharacterized protein